MWPINLVHQLGQFAIHFVLKPYRGLFNWLWEFFEFFRFFVHLALKFVLDLLIHICSHAFFADVLVYLLDLLFTCFFDDVLVEAANDHLLSFILRLKVNNFLFEFSYFRKGLTIKIFEIRILSKSLKMSPDLLCIRLIKLLCDFLPETFDTLINTEQLYFYFFNSLLNFLLRFSHNLSHIW